MTVISLPIAVALALGLVELLIAAASDCGVYDAGNRAGARFLFAPVLALVFWLAFVVPSVLIGIRWRRTGIVVGLALVGLVVALSILTVVGTVEEGGPPFGDRCPTGLPDWWPWFLPR